MNNITVFLTLTLLLLVVVTALAAPSAESHDSSGSTISKFGASKVTKKDVSADSAGQSSALVRIGANRYAGFKRPDPFAEYGHFRFGKRAQRPQPSFADYGHLRFGKRAPRVQRAAASSPSPATRITGIFASAGALWMKPMCTSRILTTSMTHEDVFLRNSGNISSKKWPFQLNENWASNMSSKERRCGFVLLYVIRMWPFWLNCWMKTRRASYGGQSFSCLHGIYFPVLFF